MKKFIWLLLPVILLLAFQSITFHISGVVTDESGNPVSGVTITVKGRGTRAVSDKNGNYNITVDDKDATLVFSSIGFESKTIKTKGHTTINVIMKALPVKLEEVVVTGMTAEVPVTAYASPSRKDRSLMGSTAGIQMRGVAGIYGNHSSYNTEDYDGITENGFRKALDEPLSTFSIDVDAASYSNIRRYLNGGQLPPEGAVRIEEMINYFRYDYKVPPRSDPFSIFTETASCPWNSQHKLVMIGLQGKRIPVENLPPSNLVFLIDVSGSMQGPERLGLVKSSLKLLVDQLREEDRISIVVYAGAAGLVLPATSGANKTRIREALDRLEAGGSTAGGAGIGLAYEVAREQFKKNGNNRVILCTDGDFNVGVSSDAALESMIEKERESGVFLTVLGYGMGNYKDNKMQKLADKGNGNHAYIDNISEARKVLVSEFGGTLYTIAKDVKLQVEFNPAKVAGYRLIGYENRLLNKEDFNDDKKDAGELGSGHTVTALYEVIPAGVKSKFLKEVDPLKYQSGKATGNHQTDEMLTVKFRYKQPDKGQSLLLEQVVKDGQNAFVKATENLRFATAVASFGMLLRNSEYKGTLTYSQVHQLARNAQTWDPEGYRKEFMKLVQKAAALSKETIGDDVAVQE